MAYCAQCGAPLQEGARYCGSCGTARAAPTVPSAPAPPPQAGAPPAPKDTSGAQSLLLVGAILGVLLPLLAAFALLLVGAATSFIPFAGPFVAAIFGIVAAVFVVISIVWALVVLHARKLIAEGRVHDGAVIAVVAGLLMLLLGLPFLVVPGLAGIVVLLGGILAWTA
ncbi:MAG TPA: zinc ribbon domain-containing protein [Candidatus Thermoplasmatota archaeon]|jgi:hypothetical protein|nr:zinc ribbon domain-containing protein [Candidatus Thermoplasmatota archaeon]